MTRPEILADINKVTAALRPELRPSVQFTLKHTNDKIGDTLLSVPFLLHLANTLRTTVSIDGQFNRLVRPLMARMPFSFGSMQNYTATLHFSASVHEVFEHARTHNCHMLESYFHLFDLAPPPILPISLPLSSEACGLAPGVVVSPFSGSDTDEHHWKIWWPDRWLEVMAFLVRRNIGSRIYIVGSRTDDFRPYERSGAVPVIDEPLPRVLDLLRRSSLLLSIDNGISHLAHFGDVTRAVQIVPKSYPSRMVFNPRAVQIYDHPRDISPARMISAIRACLRQ